MNLIQGVWDGQGIPEEKAAADGVEDVTEKLEGAKVE